MAIVTLPDHGLSTSAQKRSKTWIKHLVGVDTSRADGWAFQGQFRSHGAVVEVDDGAWFLGYVEDVRASGRLDGRDVTLYQVRGATGLVEVRAWRLDAAGGWALKVRDEIAAIMQGPPEPPEAPSVDALLAEREALLARIAEIDTLLPPPTDTEVDARHAAQVLGVSVRTAQRWASQGRVEARKDSAGHWVITVTIATATEGQ